MIEFQSVVGDAFHEKTIEKSRFLTYVSHTEGEEAARSFLTKVRGIHPQATHVCFGSIADKIGNEQRFSDDGEPQGTAGLPILNVLKGRKIYETTVAVVRYFGGIKLGAGGLARAYSGCAADGLDAAELKTFSEGAEIFLEVEYGQIDAAIRFLEQEVVVSRDFGATAKFCVMVKESQRDDFILRAHDYFNGKVKIEAGKTGFYPF